jgi:putative ATP-dependent endonuclease of OLD family
VYLTSITITNFRCFGEGNDRFELPLKAGLTALVGENETGKTAVIDALRFALGTTDQEWYRLEDRDFHKAETFREITIVCKFSELNEANQRAFVEYLTYEDGGKTATLYVNWTAKSTGETPRGKPYRRVETTSGKAGDGPVIAPELRELLAATYLRPLRDAEQALSAGRTSRLSQILHYIKKIKESGVEYDPNIDNDPKKLNVLGIGDFANALLEKQEGVVDARNQIDERLKHLCLSGDEISSTIQISSTASPEQRLRNLLEKFELVLVGPGKLGLGSNNLLFMACELLLLAQQDEGTRLLLIEEPEAHLHPQRQLRIMKSLQNQVLEEKLQIIVTTHSPNLASAIDLENMVIIRDNRAFPLSKGQTETDSNDYGFLKRFLDVTKANLFFARGVAIVEGDAENILLPTLARILDRDFTDNGVSIVNVGGVGLRRYARIFQRKDVTNTGELTIPVACITDADVMPDCAPEILGKAKAGEAWPQGRRWKAKKDFNTENALAEYRQGKVAKASGQRVRTFVSDEWTLEYDLALGPKDENGKFGLGLAEEVYVAACLAEQDEGINEGTKKAADVEADAVKSFAALKGAAKAKDGCTAEEVIAANVYAKFGRENVSKAVAAQYLAERLASKHCKGNLNAADLRSRLPKYLTEAIDYVTTNPL